MNKIFALFLLICFCEFSYSQNILASWSQQNIENYTKEKYDEVQSLSSSDLATKNINDKSWSDVFLTLNASLNNYSKNKDYLDTILSQITDQTVTKLEGTSRLIIWERIISKDITFEGKGLIISNDLFTVAGRANQILQNLTNKNFGYVGMNSEGKELVKLQSRWLSYFENQKVDEVQVVQYVGAKIPEICSLKAIHAMIVSLQDNSVKNEIMQNCLISVYDLEEMPNNESSSARFCNPDTYTNAYLGMLFGEEKFDSSKDAYWWLSFWDKNREQMVWNSEMGIYSIDSKK